MKLLILYVDKFAYKTAVKNLESVDLYEKSDEVRDAVVAFIHLEAEDEEHISKAETRLIKQLKWAARKNETKRILLHSFAHLSTSKADAEVTKELLDRTEARLSASGYETGQTPFGYFLDLDIQAPGKSLARIFKDL